MPLVSPGPRPRRLGLPLLPVLVLLAACSSSSVEDAGTDPSPAGTAAAEAAVPSADDTTRQAPTAGPQDDQPDPGGSASDLLRAVEVDIDVDAPQGWRVWQVGALVFAAPPDFDVSPDLDASATAVTLVPPDTDDGELLGAIQLFAEDAELGPLEVRAQLTEDVRNDQLGTEPLEEARPLDVPGSQGGSLLLWEYEQVVEPTGRTVPSLIGELDVLMAEGPQYSASISGATEILTREDIEAVVASARVVDVAEG